MAEGTAALRAAAPHWSLAGDQQLLEILQNIHQRVISRCNETTARLEVMARGLRDASVNLQNVNNKFLALSNTQFVESRVYEDDTDLAPPPAQTKDSPQLSELSSDLCKLRNSLRVLEGYHEPLHILRDSDSDSDSDGGDDRLVLKPKDLYSDRPLPYIIGSQDWKRKWHAGLIQDDSDSDSSTSKVEAVEQYSESEDEQTDRQTTGEFLAPRKQSTDSSSQSEAIAVSVSPVRPSPSLVAAELARRLGGDAKLPEREPVYTEPETVVRKLYKPQQTPSAPIFSDEPPPLDSDEDIFAELHKPRHHSNVHDSLFDFSPKNSLDEALFGKPPSLPDESENESQFEDDLIPDTRSRPEVRSPPEVAVRRDDNIKKPIGGISLFGTNKHAESIGAAILNRNRRKSSTSGDESNTEDVREPKKAKEVKEVKKERDIFDDLFAKSEKLNKKSARVEEEVVKEVKKDVKPKKDIFSDIFDDIDDIFSTDIVSVPVKDTKKDEKPLFDDDDDLFAEIPKVPKPVGNKVEIPEKRNVFDDNKVKTEAKDSKINVVKDIKKESKSIFDSDSDDGIFTNVAKDSKGRIDETKKPVEYKISDDIFGDDDGDDLFSSGKSNNLAKSKILSKATEVKKAVLFDSDEELFANDSNKNVKDDNVTKNDAVKENDDHLFVTEVKRPEKELRDGKSINDSSNLFNEKSALKVIESINNDIFNDGDDLFKKSEAIKETKIETVHDDVDDDKLFATDVIPNNNSLDKTQEEKTSPIENSNDFEPETTNDIFNKPDTQIGNILRTTRIAADEEIVQTEKPTDIFEDSDDELFKSPPVPKTNVKEVYKNDNLQQDTPESSSAETVQPESVKSDIFADIFDDVPPIFEKPKEPKKSQNVNALYGDDSDDEALFFKKNDVINDERADFSPSEERFGIFNDEPPALEVDFTQKPVKSDIPQKVDKTDDFTPNLAPNDDPVPKLNVKDDLNLPKEVQDTTDNTTKEPKKIGKLKPMNFNINVNTLLPGASPKKKQVEDSDGHTASNEELHKTDKIEPKMVKSISFDDPEILDNKISKERAKIQVKRRPSTRRARREAVRKSAIDLTDSSLDSSNDNSVKDDVKVVKTVYILNDDDIFGNPEKKDEGTKKHLNIVDSDEELFKKTEVVDDSVKESDNKSDATIIKEVKKSFLDSDDDELFKPKPEVSKEVKNDNIFLDSDDSDDLFKTNTKSKTVNQKNDPDVFKSTKTSDVKKETASFLDSDDDLFKSKTTKLSASLISASSDEELFATKKGVETLGKTYKSDTIVNTRKTSTQNDRNDFPKTIEVNEKPIETKEVKKVEVVAKKSILDVSSDEDDLFKSRTVLNRNRDKNIFGDSDQEDLFGAKSSKEPKQNDTPPQSTKEAKPTEAVFVDPLSLFGDDE